MALEEAVARIKTETHRFVRQQYTWFRPDDPDIHWFDVSDESVAGDVMALVQRWLDA